MFAGQYGIFIMKSVWDLMLLLNSFIIKVSLGAVDYNIRNALFPFKLALRIIKFTLGKEFFPKGNATTHDDLRPEETDAPSDSQRRDPRQNTQRRGLRGRQKTKHLPFSCEKKGNNFWYIKS